MLRRTFITSLALFFALIILGVSVARTSAQQPESFGEEMEQSEVLGGDEAVLAAESEVAEPVEYPLPYPGSILPGHFLYPVKMIRDRIWLWLTTDSLKKAELLLHFADKRLETGRLLMDDQKVDDGLTTITKAEKYLEQATNQERAAFEDGKDTAPLLERLSKAVQKHEEVMLELKAQAPPTADPVLDTGLGYTQRVREQVQQSKGR